MELAAYLRHPRTLAEIEAWRLGLAGEAPTQEQAMAGLAKLGSMGLLLDAESPEALAAEAPRPVVSGCVLPSPQQPLASPIRVSYVPYERCNLRCIHCQAAEYDGFRGPHGRLSLDESLELLGRLDELGLLELHITGGEPALHPDFATLLHAAAGYRYNLVLNTNATVMDDAIADAIADVFHSREGVLGVGVGIDGHDAESYEAIRGVQGAFAQALAGLDQLRRRDVAFDIGALIHAANRDCWREMVDLARRVGAGGISFQVASLMGRAPSSLASLVLPLRDIDALEDEILSFAETCDDVRVSFARKHQPSLRERSPKQGTLPDAVGAGTEEALEHINYPPHGTCGAGMTACAVNADGRVYPCIDSLGAEGLSFGSLRERDLLSIWRDSRWDVLRGSLSLEDLRACAECSGLPFCHELFCRAYPAATTGNWSGPKPECLAHAEELSLVPAGS
jgi:radical SAM protein with 4Fe4S-binding SPASM domain